MPTSADNARPQFELRERYRINWFLGAALALLSILTAAYLEFDVTAFVLAGVLLICLAVLRPHWTAKIPRGIWHAIPFLLLLFLAADFYRHGETLPALVRLNLLLIVYRTLTFRRKREDLQLLVLCLFMIVIVGVLTVAMSFILQILAFTAGAMWFLFNLTLMEHDRHRLRPEDVWTGFSWSAFRAGIWGMRDPRSLALAGVTFFSLMSISTLAFLIIPRVDMTGKIPFLSLAHGGQTGFSESMRLGDITNIKNNPKVALRVEAPSDTQGPPAGLRDPYWRLLVLDEYSRGVFRVSHAVVTNARSRSRARELKRTDELFGSSFHAPVKQNELTFYLEGGVSRYLPLTGSFEKIRFQEPSNILAYPALGVVAVNRSSSKMLVYQVSNMETGGDYFDSDFGLYSLEYPWHPEFDFFHDQEYTNYPETTYGLPRREEDREILERIVEEILDGDELNAEEFAARAKRYLANHHGYSMSFVLPRGPSEGGWRRGERGEGRGRGRRDPIARWLDSDLPGHCEMFAGAFVLLCRTAGFPARVVTGFRGGSWNAYENYFMVRYSDAHAWAEVYDDYARWFRVDPTPETGDGSVPGAGDPGYFGVALDSSFAAYIDSLRITWYRRVVSFDHQAQFELFDWVRKGYGKIDLRSGLQKVRDTLLTWAAAPWDQRRIVDFLGIVGSGVVFFILVCAIARRDLLRKLGTLWVPCRQCPVRRKAGIYLQRFEASERPVEDKGELEVHRELQRIRYGADRYHAAHRTVFRRARGAIRRRRRGSPPAPASY